VTPRRVALNAGALKVVGASLSGHHPRK